MAPEAGFHVFSAAHLAALGLISGLGALIVRASRCGGDTRAQWIGRTLGALLVGYVIAIYATLWATGSFDPSWALPLELCHWVLVATTIALFKPNRLASEIAYFWGLGGTVQAVLTPDLFRGFPSWDFLFFFWGHGVTLLGIVYLLAFRRFRPARGSVARVFLFLNLYALAAGATDYVTGWNYGYLRQKPAAGSLLDYLGPWPWYILSLEFLAAAMFLLLALPWSRPLGIWFSRTGAVK